LYNTLVENTAHLGLGLTVNPSLMFFFATRSVARCLRTRLRRRASPSPSSSPASGGTSITRASRESSTRTRRYAGRYYTVIGHVFLVVFIYTFVYTILAEQLSPVFGGTSTTRASRESSTRTRRCAGRWNCVYVFNTIVVSRYILYKL